MIPRGIRSNNPGNIRRSHIEWVGEVLGNDSEFENFDTMEHGIRAMAKVLRTYQRDRGCKTVMQIVERYAPASENDTSSYAAHVADMLGVGLDEPIDLSDDEMLRALIAAMIRHENGRKEDKADWVDAETIKRGVEMA